VARAAGVSLLSARKLWRALGFAHVTDDDLAFTEADLDALRRTVSVVRRGLLDEPTTIALARALGQSADRLASWQTETIAAYLDEAGISGDSERVAAHLDELLDDLEALVVYTWRRRVADAAARMLAAGAVGRGSSAKLTVGFADLVSYTRLSRELDHRALGRLVQRFEGLAADVVTAGGGRVVKTVGDEVLFTAEDPVAAAVIALSLSERMAADKVVPDLRVGFAYGHVVHSLGDVYGPTVNLASRLTALAPAGAVVTDPATAAKLASDPEFVIVPQLWRWLRGVGLVQPLLLTRRTPGAPLIAVDDG
jgi:adenylate cyclase